MNCQDFRNIVDELADDKLMDARTREAGRGHATICGNCAAQLSAARTLSSGFQIAAGAETEETPARVKQALLASFAEQRKGASQQEVAPLVVIEISGFRKLPWWVAAASVAAAAVLLLAMVLPSLRRISLPVPETQASIPNPALPVPTAPTPENPRGVTPAPEGKTVRQKTISKRTTDFARRAPRLSNGSGNNETATVARTVSNDYFPLTYLDSATAMESGTVVRIELSRSALISLGLPMNVERANELVKADLVVGDDGVARAIRLVQSENR